MYKYSLLTKLSHSLPFGNSQTTRPQWQTDTSRATLSCRSIPSLPGLVGAHSGEAVSGHFALDSTRASLSLSKHTTPHHTTLHRSPLGAPSDRILSLVLERELTGGETQGWRALAVASFVKWDPELSHLALNQKKSINLSRASDCQLFHRVFFL